jgi:hypothetical protein
MVKLIVPTKVSIFFQWQSNLESDDDIPELPLPSEIQAVTPDDVIDDVLKQIDSQYPTR